MADDVKNRLNAKLEHAKVLSHEELSEGVHSLELAVGDGGLPAKELAYLTGQNGERSPLRFHEGGRVISRDFIRRIDLDLLTGKPSVLREQSAKLYTRAIQAYHTKGSYGTVIDTLTNFSAKGFKNDVDDPDIKLFYDTWNRDINFPEVVEKIFFDFFRVGLVRTFKMVGKFDPKLRPENFGNIVKKKAQANSFATGEHLQKLMAYRDYAAAKKVWSKAFVPLKYTILNPTLIEIKGSLLFDQTDTYIKPDAFKEIADMMKSPGKLTPEQRKFVAALPNELKEDIKKRKPVKLPPELVGKCDYRRQDYERYPRPRGARAFDDMAYKEDLRRADFSTLDGITNYILKVTVGNDNHPVTNQTDLDTVAKLFDTSSKSFDIVWNHTLNIEKITFPEISTILGQDKFKQVNDDLSTSFGVTRALLDGQMQGNAKAIEAATKAFTEEVNYARRCVKRWIDSEYEEVALAMGFNRYPQVRFDDLALKDEIMMMSVVQGMIDRRIISYESGIEKLGFDYTNELANMIQEQPLVQSGRLGVIGSPYNPKALPAETPPADKDTTPGGKETVVTQKDLKDFQKNMEQMLKTGLQKNQGTPKGTPSEGRPRGRPAKSPAKSTKPNTKPRKPNTTKQGRKKDR
jgi:hypothetical protein